MAPRAARNALLGLGASMKTAIAFGVVLIAAAAGAGTHKPLVRTFETDTVRSGQSRIDQLVSGRLRELGIQPAPSCSDAVFVRRAFLDVIGTLPTAQEARQFLLDRSPRKRRVLIDRLLERDEFADYWAMKWCDLLRVKSEFPINLWPNAVQAYHRWIRTCIKENMPYDRFAREMLTASGSNFRVPQVNFYRSIQGEEPQVIALAVALTFMGVRAENWPQDRLAGLAAFFSRVGYKPTAEWKEEIVFFDSAKADAPRQATFPDGTAAQLSADEDPREVFANWLIKPENPWFARNMVNRIWYWLLGRGIVHEPDDIRPDNPPENPRLLARLERELLSSRYDLKKIYRLILNSKTYQQSSIARADPAVAAAHFACYPLRRLEAEVLIDALCQITGTTETYSSPIPEPFSFIPAGQRSIALADGSISSPFLDLFGRPPRDTGLASERNNRPTAAQRLHLLNSSHLQRKITRSQKLRRLIQSSRNRGEIATKLYLTVLSRFPTDEELKIAQRYAQSGKAKGREALIDLTWALVNSAEFLYRH